MKDFPAIKLAILFAAGILLGKFSLIDSTVFVAALLSVISLFFLHRHFDKNILHISVNVLVYTCILFSGNLIAQLNQSHYHLLPENVYRIKNVKVVGRITDIELPRKDKIVFNVESHSINLSDSLINEDINFICVVRDDKKQLNSLYNELKVGNIIHFTGNFYKGNEERNPGEFDYSKYLRSNGISGIITTYDVSKIKIVDSQGNVFANTVFVLRKKIDAEIRSLYNEQSSALLRGLLLADRSEISYNTKTQFINSGVIHILAVSGLHVGFIIMIYAFLFGRFNIYLRSILTAIGLILYLILIGPPASAFRAGVMALVLIIAFLTNRSTNLLNSVAIAALIILLVHPYELFSPGFQLSFAAVISIAIIYPHISEWIKSLSVQNKPVKNILLFAGVSIAAQIGTMPFTIYYFGKVSLVALFTNLIVIPVVGIIVSVGILSIAVGLIIPAVAVYFSIVNEIIIKIVFYVIHLTGSSEFSFQRIRSFSPFDIILFYVLLTILLFFYKKFNGSLAKVVLLVLCLSNFFLFSSFDNKKIMPDNKLSVMMIDVGQGDAFLLKFPNGKTALIDAGVVTFNYDNGERVILPLMNYIGIGKIDYGFVSHIDLDHYGGFISLIHDGKISSIYKPEIDSSESKDVKFEKYLFENKIPENYYRKGIIKIGNARVYVLNTLAYNTSTSNNRSGLLKIVYGNSEFLFTGDLEKGGEAYYSKMYGNFLDSDVLKVGHHGSKTSSSEDFLNLVTPEISLISDGRQNKFHHPSEITLEKLKEIHSKVYRTDLSGAILLQSDGNTIKKVNWKEL
jgi:competence protein ComEC